MVQRDGPPEPDEAVAAFVERVETANLSDLQRLLLFGSVARSTHGRDSDVDILAAVADGADEVAIEERL